MIDRSKLPANLVLRRVWVLERGSERRSTIAYLIDRRRRLVGVTLISVGGILAVLLFLVTSAFWLAFAALLLTWAGAVHAGGGGTGFYEVRDDGTLGDYLGPSKPSS